MNLSGVQQFASDQIMAVPALAAFGDPLQYSLLLDDATVRVQLADRLRTAGVTFEIGLPSGTDDQSSRGRFAQLLVDFDVFVAENPKIEHTPSGIDLVTAVVKAVTARVDSETAARCTAYDAAKSENGYALHIISFNVPVLIR